MIASGAVPLFMKRQLSTALLLIVLGAGAHAQDAADASPAAVGTLEAELNAVRDGTGVNLVVDWASLERVGITPDTPIELRLEGVSGRTRLNFALRLAGAEAGLPPEQVPVWGIRDGVVIVSAASEPGPEELKVVVYRVADLVHRVPDFDDAPVFDLTEILPGGRER